ncbi:hypothetical protein JCM17380_41130 [Desulfosporosinus burensis]
MKDRGSALLTAVISIMILVSISGVFFTMVMSHTKLESSEEKGLTAYYLAEAGVQYGIAKVLDENIKKGDPLPESETVNDPFGQGGSFKVQWQDSEDGPSFIVTSTGTYLGIIRKKVAEYKYGDDNDDDDDDDDDDDCEDDDVLPDYPLWVAQVYSTSGTYVIYNGRVFYNIWYAHASDVPGASIGGPWQELTKQWRNFNVYHTNDIVCYNGKKFQARNNSTNQQPGLVSSPWQELTNQWRDFNVYNTGDIVIYNSKQFRARNYSNNQQPGLLSSPWQELTDEWRSFNVYITGDEVVYNGHRYRAEWYSQNAQPDISAAWKLMS